MKKTSDLVINLKYKIANLAEKYRIVYAILFGSQIERRAVKGESDIDLAIKAKELDKSESYNFLKRILNEIGVDNLDIIIVNFAPFSIIYDILTKGKVIFCNDYEELFEDRLKAIKLYDDWIHFSKVFEEREVRKVIG